MQFYPLIRRNDNFFCIALVSLCQYFLYPFFFHKPMVRNVKYAVRDERLSPLEFWHKHKDVDIDGVVTECASLKDRRLALCLGNLPHDVTVYPFSP